MDSKNNKKQQALPKKEADAYLQDLETLSADPRYNEPGSPARESLKQAMEKARELYQERASRNDWGEVAQTVGRALAQYGAARSGMRSGQDMSNLPMGRGIDFGSRGDRLLQEYRQDIANARDLDQLDRQAAQEARQTGQKEYGRKEDYLKTALSIARGREEEQARLARERAGDARSDSRESLADKRLQLQDIREQEKLLQKQLQARQQLVNELGREEDLSPRSAKKLQEKYGQLAAQGDVDLNQLQAELVSTDKPGRLWGTNPDPEARKKKLADKVEEIKALLAETRKAREQLLGPVAPQKQAPQEPRMVRMRAPDGTIGEVPEAQVEAALRAGATRLE
jgi:hypothetical protein